MRTRDLDDRSSGQVQIRGAGILDRESVTAGELPKSVPSAMSGVRITVRNRDAVALHIHFRRSGRDHRQHDVVPGGAVTDVSDRCVQA